MSYDSTKNKKQVDWVVIPPQEFSELKNASLASVSVRVSSLHKVRTILSRRLTFKAINVTHDIASAFVGVS